MLMSVISSTDSRGVAPGRPLSTLLAGGRGLLRPFRHKPKNILAKTAALIVGGLLAVSAGAAAAQPSEEAARFVQSVCDRATHILQSANTSEDVKRDELRGLLEEVMDLPRIGRFTLGGHWENVSLKQQSDFQSLFSNFVLNTYASLLLSESDSRFVVVKSEALKDGNAIVHTRVERSSGDAVDTVWQIGKAADGQYRVLDISADGVSLAETYRATFSALMANGGMPVLLAALKKRT